MVASAREGKQDDRDDNSPFESHPKHGVVSWLSLHSRVSRRKQGKHDEREEDERQRRLEQKFIPSEDVPTERHHPCGPIR